MPFGLPEPSSAHLWRFDEHRSSIAHQLERLLRGCPALPVSHVQVMAQLRHKCQSTTFTARLLQMIFHNLPLTLPSNHPSASFQVGICCFTFCRLQIIHLCLFLKQWETLQFSVDDSEHVCLQMHQRGQYKCSGEEESREEKDALMGP